MKRDINIDFLKFISIIAVVMTHVVSELLDFQVHSLTWTYGIFINTLIKFCVPVFLMCTGAIMLNNKEISLKKLYSKYILRFLCALVFWNGIYQVLNEYYLIKDNLQEKYDFTKIFTSLFSGNEKYHLYFMYIIILCYIFLPIVKKMVLSLNNSEYKYLLILIFITASIVPYIFSFYAIDSKSFFRNYAINICYLGIGYMIFGKYLKDNKDKYSGKVSIFLAILILCGVVIDIYFKSSRETFMTYWNVINPFIFLYSCLIFIWGLKLKIRSKFNNLILFLSKGSFFVYLFHLVILDFLRYKGLSIMNLNLVMKLLYPLVITFILVFISYILYFVLSKIPVVNKYLI